MNNKQFTGSESADNPVKFMEDEHEDDDDYDEETVAKVDYYAILGVERTATLQEIKTAFRKLSRESHPDIQIQNDKNLQTNSVSEDKDKLKRYFEQKQQRLTEAYDVLSHPSKRSLYDRFGTVDFQLVKVEGVETEDLIETLSSQKRQKRAAIREMRTNASTQTVMNIDATNLIGAVLNGGELQGQETFITVPSTSMSQNFQTPISKDDIIIFHGHAKYDRVRNALNHVIAVGHRHQINPKHEHTHVHTSLVHTNSAPNSFVLSSHYYTKLNDRSTGSIGALFHLAPYADVTKVIRPLGFDFRYKRILFNDKSLMGEIKVTFPQEAGVVFEVQKAFSKSTLGVEIRTSSESHIALEYGYELKRKKPVEPNQKARTVKLLSNVSVTDSGAYDASLLLTKRVTSSTELGVGLGVSNDEISLRCSYRRDRHFFNFPIKISNELDYKAILLATIAPTALYLGINTFIYKPLRRRWKRQELYEKRIDNYHKTQNQREKALQEKEKMRDAILRSRVNEESVQGLLIINARYGNLQDDEGVTSVTPQDELPPYIDVTDQLQFQVLNSRLHLPPVSKTTLDGFYDPCPGEEKSLSIIYRFLNTTHRVEVHDEDELEIPSEEDKLGGEEPTTDDQYEEEEDDN